MDELRFRGASVREITHKMQGQLMAGLDPFPMMRSQLNFMRLKFSVTRQHICSSSGAP